MTMVTTAVASSGASTPATMTKPSCCKILRGFDFLFVFMLSMCCLVSADMCTDLNDEEADNPFWYERRSPSRCHHPQPITYLLVPTCPGLRQQSVLTVLKKKVADIVCQRFGVRVEGSRGQPMLAPVRTGSMKMASARWSLRVTGCSSVR